MTYSWGVLRGLFSPKWVGLFVVVLVVVTACTLLGLWQLGVARDEGHKEAGPRGAQLQPAPLQQVTRAHSAFEAEFSNRPVTVTGQVRRRPDDPRRRPAARGPGRVLGRDPLVTEGGTVAVLRGFVEGLPSTPPPAPEGSSPSRAPSDRRSRPGRARRCRLAAQVGRPGRLVNEWPGDLYNVVVLASDETDAAAGRRRPRSRRLA